LPLKKLKCEDMERITIEKLASTLINLDVSEKVTVDSFIADNALVSIKNMLKI